MVVALCHLKQAQTKRVLLLRKDVPSAKCECFKMLGTRDKRANNNKVYCCSIDHYVSRKSGYLPTVVIPSHSSMSLATWSAKRAQGRTC